MSSPARSFGSCQATSITPVIPKTRSLDLGGRVGDFWRRWSQKTVAQVVDSARCLSVRTRDHKGTTDKKGRIDLFSGLGNIYYEIKKEIALIR